jgi:L-fuculose-phosphate aldolase
MDAAAIKPMLVDAIRLLEHLEIIDHSGHCSARRDHDSFYINSGASLRNRLTPDDIVTVDLAGGLVEGTARPPLEFHLHAEIYRARPDAHVVMHTHPRWSTLLTIAGVAYQPVYAQGALLGAVPVMDSPLSINTKAMGERLAGTLGAGRAALLKSHGAVIVGADIIECFALATYLEENARRQYMALQIGTPYVFSAEEQDACRRNLSSPSLYQKSWDYYRSKL